MSNLNSSDSFKATFTEEQQEQINKGKELNLNVSIYANPNYNWRQMEQIRLGLEDEVDVSKYANPKYDWIQMKQNTSYYQQITITDFQIMTQ